MIINNPNYRSMPEQVDYLTDENEINKTDISNLENDVENLDGRVFQIEDDIENIQEDIETLDGAVEQNTEDISTLTSEVEAVSGRGGYLIPHNFETDTPTENQLNVYALSQIPNITQPEEIFNGTRVTNLYNNHTWILNNTQDTDPVVFEWVDLGQSLVSIATENTLGVVKGSPSDFNVTVNNDGTMSVNGIANALNGKQDKLTLNEVQSGTITENIGFNNIGEIVRQIQQSGGSGKYLHILRNATSYSSLLFMTFIVNDNNNAISLNDFKTFLINNNYQAFSGTQYPCIFYGGKSNTSEIPSGNCCGISGTSIYVKTNGGKLNLSVDFANETASLKYSTINSQESFSENLIDTIIAL